MEADMAVQAYFGLKYILGILVVLGAGYPLISMACYPLYKWAGGKQTFREYVKSI